MSNDRASVATGEAEVDWTSKTEYSRLVEEEIEEYSNIEVTESLREGGIHAADAWAFWFHYLIEHVWKTSLYAEVVDFCNGIEAPRILSLGCGYGGVELQIARGLRPGFEMLAVDLNASILTQARTEAARDNLNVTFAPLDLNYVEIERDSFDVIFAHASLHHVLNLEHVASEIYKGLKKDGRLIVNDIIGKTQVLFWEANIKYATELLRRMPAKWSAGVSLPPYVEPSIQVGMEGIRQEEIEFVLQSFFNPIKMFKYGSFMRLICTHPELGQRFKPMLSEDRDYLLSIFDLDVRQVELGKLAPTEMLAVYEKKSQVDVEAINQEARRRMSRFFESQSSNA